MYFSEQVFVCGTAKLLAYGTRVRSTLARRTFAAIWDVLHLVLDSFYARRFRGII